LTAQIEPVQEKMKYLSNQFAVHMLIYMSYRGVTIPISHNKIHITIFGSRSDTYNDT